MERTGAPAGGSFDLDLVDGLSAALDREAVRDPGRLRSGLERIDARSREGAMHRLQAGIGNSAIGGLMARTAQRPLSVRRPAVGRAARRR